MAGAQKKRKLIQKKKSGELVHLNPQNKKIFERFRKEILDSGLSPNQVKYLKENCELIRDLINKKKIEEVTTTSAEIFALRENIQRFWLGQDDDKKTALVLICRVIEEEFNESGESAKYKKYEEKKVPSGTPKKETTKEQRSAWAKQAAKTRAKKKKQATACAKIAKEEKTKAAKNREFIEKMKAAKAAKAAKNKTKSAKSGGGKIDKGKTTIVTTVSNVKKTVVAKDENQFGRSYFQKFFGVW